MFSFYSKAFRPASWKAIVVTAVFLTLIANVAFFKNVIHVYPLSLSTLPFIISLGVLVSAINIIVFTLFA